MPPKRQMRQRPNTPRGVVVTAADYAGKVHDDQLLLTASVKLTQFDDGWQIVRLPLAGLSLQSAALDDQPAAVSRDGRGSQHADGLHRHGRRSCADAHAHRPAQIGRQRPGGGVPDARCPRRRPHAGAVAEGKSLLVDGLKQQRTAEGDAADIECRSADARTSHCGSPIVISATPPMLWCSRTRPTGCRLRPAR